MDADWQGAIDKLEAGIAELDANGGDGTITFTFSAPDGRASSAELTRKEAAGLVRSMRKDKEFGSEGRGDA